MSDKAIYTVIMTVSVIMGVSALMAGVATGTIHNIVLGFVFLLMAKIIRDNTKDLWQRK